MKGKLANGVGSPVLFTLPRNTVYPALLPLMQHTSDCQQSTELTPPTGPIEMDSSVSRERRNLVSARVPSHFNWPLHVATAGI